MMGLTVIINWKCFLWPSMLQEAIWDLVPEFRDSGQHAPTCHTSATCPWLKLLCGQDVWHLVQTGGHFRPPIKKIIYKSGRNQYCEGQALATSDNLLVFQSHRNKVSGLNLTVVLIQVLGTNLITRLLEASMSK